MKYILLIQILLLILITAILGCGSENLSFINEPQSSETSVKGSKSITVSDQRIENIIEGTNLGQRIPDVKMTLLDGTEITTGELVRDAKPTFLFFNAIFCPMCREELKKLHTIYPDYIGKVTFFSVGIDPTETLIDLNSQREQGGYAWDISVAGVGMLSSLNVVQQSTKIAFNEDFVESNFLTTGLVDNSVPISFADPVIMLIVPLGNPACSANTANASAE